MSIKRDCFIVAGHRGYCGQRCYPENTVTAFRQALDDGCDMVELDVRYSSDFVLVLMHDSTVDRTTNGSGNVKEMTFAELRALDAGTELCPEKIPTFEEVLVLVKERGSTVNIEFKEYFTEGNEERAVRCIEEVIALVEKYGMGEDVIINSFDAKVLEYVYKKWGKRYPLHGFYPYTRMKRVEIDPEEYLYCACVSTSEDEAACDYLTSRGIEPWLGGGVVEKEHLVRLISHGAKLVTANNSLDIIRKLKGEVGR